MKTTFVILLACVFVLGLSRDTFSGELELDELIQAIRANIVAAEKRAKEDARFAVKEVELTVSYALEKQGESGFKAVVITVGGTITSQAVQTMKLTLTPTNPVHVRAPAPSKSPSTTYAKVEEVDKKGGVVSLRAAGGEEITLRVPRKLLEGIEPADSVAIDVRKVEPGEGE